MRRLLALVLLLACPPAAAAAPVLELGHDGRVVRRDDPFLARAFASQAPLRSTALPAARAVAADRTYLGELARLWRHRQITTAQYRTDRGAFLDALRAVRRLSGTRANELQSVVTIAHGIAASGQLTASRLPALTLTLERNRQWWTTGSLLSDGDRIEFAGSDLVWQYYAGSGIQLQELGSFGKADGFFTGGPALYPRLRGILSELIPLASARAGGLTWEYYFPFDGGSPPWTSAMSQATAIEALTRAYVAFHDPTYLAVAHRALPVLRRTPPLGVAAPAAAGRWFLLYSFAPHALVINGFLQTLIGLYDYAHASRDPEAAALFAAGDAEARRALPSFDTGGWSLYQPGIPASLDYHELVTGFADQLCKRTAAPVYCTTAAHFHSYLTTPPALALLTTSARSGGALAVRFSVSKPAHVGIVVAQADRTVFLTSADFDGGREAFSLPSLPPGSYDVRLGATDLAGNFAHIAGTLEVRGGS